MTAVFLHMLDLLGVAVFAATGALVASRKEMDLIGFLLLATLTGIGGGTLRDLVLGRPVFWVADQTYLWTCAGIAFLIFFAAPMVQRRHAALVWLDGLGLAAYGVLGAEIARLEGASFMAAISLGLITATFGGMLRDVVSGEQPLILQSEIYATAALMAAAVHVGLTAAGLAVTMAALSGASAGFALRAGAIRHGWTLPRYRPRPGRKP